MSTIGALRQKALEKGTTRVPSKNALPPHKPAKHKTKYKWDAEAYRKGQQYKKR
jgi:hypothetical protein